MGNPFAPLMGAIPARSVTRYQGVMTGTQASLAVNVNGSIIPCRVLDPLVVAPGDPVAVDLIAGPSGQAEAWIVGRLTATPRPAQGTVTTVPPSSPTITVTGTDGVAYAATFVASYTPAVNDTVALLWAAGAPVVVGKPTTTAAPAPVAQPAAPPPALPQTGTSTYAATDSSTWWGPGGWDSWAGGGGNVFQGDYGSGPLTGAWFYAASPAELAGRTITRVRLTLGARRSSGSYNSPVTVNVYTHTSANRPGTNIATGSASTTLTAQPGQGPTTYDLPVAFATDLLNGGGIAITGGTYAGFTGRLAQPNSGLLQIDWSR